MPGLFSSLVNYSALRARRAVSLAQGAAACAVVLACANPAGAQSPPADAQDHSQHAGHGAATASLFLPREASGTAWVPDQAPMFGVHRTRGPWELMAHGAGFAQFLLETGEAHRGSHQAGSINWLMLMARRPAGPGRVGLRAMVSAEPWTIPGCGYPDLLATGETCDGDTIHDRQHPHDLFMELAVEYERALAGSLRWQAYAGLAGEPALGPAGFPHRPSAFPNPLAPIGHHWLDATHITFGVVTAGLFTSRWKLEASAFNGREPDGRRWDLDLAVFDSFSGRVSVAASPSLVFQVSAGRLNDAEGHASLPRTDVTRVTASTSWQRALRRGATSPVPGGAGNTWATTLGWGVNVEPDGRSHALLLESALALGSAHAAFGRFEVVGKPAHDLHVHESEEVFAVAKLQVGYTRYLRPRGAAQVGLGGTVSGSVVPLSLMPRYGGRLVPGFGIFATIRPAAHAM